MKMPIRTLIPAALVAACFFSVSCHKEEKSASSQGASKAGVADMPPDTVVAKIGSQSITSGELNAQAQSRLNQLDDQYQKQRFQIRKQQLDEMINDRLLKAEAQKRGITQEQLLKTEVDDKVPPPSEDQIKKVFDDNSSQLPPGSTLETFRPQIVQFLTRNQKQEKAQQLVERLRKENHVEVKFEEPRVAVEAKGPERGPANAKVTIVEFSDFECPYCGRAFETVEQVMNSYPGKVRLFFRNYPLPFHPHAEKSAEAAMCADEQNKFWAYHDVLFKNQHSLELPQLKEHAKSLGLDTAKFDQCLDSGKFAQRVKEDQEAGSKVGVTGTPAFFINGVMVSGAQPFDEFKKIIDKELGS